MTDDTLDFGLGGIASPPDENDWSIDSLYAMAGAEPLASPPPSYLVPAPFPPILNQHSTPMCVAYSSAMLKGYEDLRDTGPATFDEPTFFSEIGGTANGAILRNALAQLLSAGYPVVSAGQPARHKIAAYYAVPLDKLSIQSAIATFGPLLIGTPWYSSWFHPVAGVLPSPDTVVGGHAIAAIGWDSRGLRLRNSWGSLWGLSGDAFLPWSMFGHVREAWKAVDQIVVPPPAARYRIAIAAGALVRIATFKGTCISGWTDRRWGPRPSGAPCGQPVVRRGCVHGQATVVRVSAGTFAGRWVHIGTGVSLVRVA